jgi:hypothetical protein
LIPRVGVAIAEEITLDVDDIGLLLLLNTVVDVLEAVVLLDEVVEAMLDALNELETTLDVEEMLLLLLDAKEERRYISNLLPAPQYS